MIEQLKKAFALAEQRPEEEQRMLADLLLEEMRVEERWQDLFADPRSSALLERMVAEAIAQDNAGQSEDIRGDTFM
jgi:hypothetical protein